MRSLTDHSPSISFQTSFWSPLILGSMLLMLAPPSIFAYYSLHNYFTSSTNFSASKINWFNVYCRPSQYGSQTNLRKMYRILPSILSLSPNGLSMYQSCIKNSSSLASLSSKLSSYFYLQICLSFYFSTNRHL